MPGRKRSSAVSSDQSAATPAGTTPATIRDIASRTGVSPGTISRVLSGAATRVPIGIETRERVVVAARELGYRPNPFARGLRGGRTMLLGAVVRDFSDLFFAAALEVLAGEGLEHGFNIVIGHADASAHEATPMAGLLEPRYLDAIVLLGDMQDQPRLMAELRRTTVPVIALWQGTSPIEFPTVDVDDRAGVILGLQHLADLGHRRIALISARLPGDNPHRRDAYLDFMKDQFGAAHAEYVVDVPNTTNGGEGALRELLNLREPPTAVMGTTDVVAVGALHAAYDAGLAIPSALSVVGYDDIVIAAHTVPALTTVRMPVTEIVHEGVRLADELTRATVRRPEPSVTMFRPSLVVRQSSAMPGP